MNVLKSFRIVITFNLLFIILLGSCGYQFESGGYLKQNITQISVTMFKNKTSESNADQVFTNELVREIVEKSNTRVVDKQKGVALIKGTINSISFETLSRSSSESVLERRVSANIDVTLLDKDGKVLSIVKGFVTEDEYAVSEDQITDESNKQEAVENIARRSAEKLVSKFLVNF